jgi:Ca-activated chloride channel family protein
VANERGIRIHTVAIGDPTTVGEEKLDAETLRIVAESSGGEYFFAGDRDQLAGIYEELDKIETRQVNVISHRPRNDLYFWPLLAAIVLWLGEKLLALLRSSHRTVSSGVSGAVRVDPLSGKLEVWDLQKEAKDAQETVGSG